MSASGRPALRAGPEATLAGRVAHEIGTALTAIAVAMDRLERNQFVAEASPPRELAIVREQSERLACLARRLVVLATPSAAEPVPLDLDEESARLAALFRGSAERAGVELRFRPSGPGVARDREGAVFLPFVSGCGGTGLGITLPRLNALGQGGTLHVERDPQNRITLVLSLEPATEEDRGEAER